MKPDTVSDEAKKGPTPDKERRLKSRVRINRAQILYNFSAIEHVEYLAKPMVTLSADNFRGKILNTCQKQRRHVMFSYEQTFNFK